MKVQAILTLLGERGVITVSEDEYYSGSEKKSENYWEYIEGLMVKNKLDRVSLYDNMWGPLLFNEKEFDQINPFAIDKAQSIVVKLSDDFQYNAVFFQNGRESGRIHNTISGKLLGMIGDFRDESAHIFKYISLVLALFASVLMFTMITSSVLAAKKEIGTLRAIGARGSDVASIFVTEAVLIAVFTSLLANIGLNIASTIGLSNMKPTDAIKNK